MPDVGLRQSADKDRHYRLLSIWDFDFLQNIYVILFFIFVFTAAFIAVYIRGVLHSAVALIITIIVLLFLFALLVKAVIALIKDFIYRLSITHDIRKLSGDSYSKILQKYDDPRLVAAYEMLRLKHDDQKFGIVAMEIVTRGFADEVQIKKRRSLIIRGGAHLLRKGVQSRACFGEKLFLSDKFILLCSSNIGKSSFLIRLNEIEKILVYPKLADGAFRVVSSNENITKDEQFEPYEVTFWVNFLKDKGIPVEE